jgi:hypothetical protein
VPGVPLLYISADGKGTAIGVCVELYEIVVSQRDLADYFRMDPRPDSIPSVSASIWHRYGIAQNSQIESVKDIIGRYRREWKGVGISGAAQHMMDLEVQAAIASAQQPTTVGTVRETIKGFVDEFVNAWLKVNASQH